MKIYHKPFLNYDNWDVPIYPHPGAFKASRKHEVHTGVDLYVPENTIVTTIEAGEIVNIVKFTGEHAGLPWWENTWAVLVKGRTGVIVYGEIQPSRQLKVGDRVGSGMPIGSVIPVIKNIKDTTISPTMLHVELLAHYRTEEAPMVKNNLQFPSFVYDPTMLLIQLKGT